MTKATHNGTCQACGRVQAVNNKTGRLAKHGYTVDYGYFSGTCSGSDKAPLEVATYHNIATVAAIREWADEQDSKSHGKISKVFISVPNPDYTWGGKRRIDVAVNREEFVSRKMEKYTHTDDQEKLDRLAGYASDDFDSKVESVRESLRRNATFARKDAELLDALRDKTFGNDLIAREVEKQIHREDFTKQGYRAADTRKAELAEKGIKATVRRNKYREITLTYRA